MLYCGFDSNNLLKKNLPPRFSELLFMLSTFQSWLIFICNLTFLCMHVAMETITDSLHFTNCGINYRLLQLLCYRSAQSSAFSPMANVMTAV